MDLTDDNSINDAMAEIRIALEGRKLHGVVNNAGVCIKGELDWLLSEQVNNMVKVRTTFSSALTMEEIVCLMTFPD